MSLNISVNFKVTSGKIIISDDLSHALPEPDSFSVDVVANFYEKLNVFNPYVGNTVLVCKYVDEAKTTIEFERESDFLSEGVESDKMLGVVSVDSRFLTIVDYDTLRTLFEVSEEKFAEVLEEIDCDLKVFNIKNGIYTGTLKESSGKYYASIKRES